MPAKSEKRSVFLVVVAAIFTNLYASADNYISANPHFCKSALKQYTQYDFIDLVSAHRIPFHEKKLGQLFCDRSAQDIIDILLKEVRQAGVKIEHPWTYSRSNLSVQRMHLPINSTHQSVSFCCESPIATGGLSIPKSGATSFGYEIAQQFGLKVLKTRAGLVPLTFQGNLLEQCRALSGLSVEASVQFGNTQFAEGLLFTHRG